MFATETLDNKVVCNLEVFTGFNLKVLDSKPYRRNIHKLEWTKKK